MAAHRNRPAILVGEAAIHNHRILRLAVPTVAGEAPDYTHLAGDKESYYNHGYREVVRLAVGRNRTVAAATLEGLQGGPKTIAGVLQAC